MVDPPAWPGVQFPQLRRYLIGAVDARIVLPVRDHLRRPCRKVSGQVGGHGPSSGLYVQVHHATLRESRLGGELGGSPGVVLPGPRVEVVGGVRGALHGLLPQEDRGYSPPDLL